MCEAQQRRIHQVLAILKKETKKKGYRLVGIDLPLCLHELGTTYFQRILTWLILMTLCDPLHAYRLNSLKVLMSQILFKYPNDHYLLLSTLLVPHHIMFPLLVISSNRSLHGRASEQFSNSHLPITRDVKLDPGLQWQSKSHVSLIRFIISPSL